MSQIKTGMFIHNTAANYNLNIGFVPDIIQLWEVLAADGHWIVWTRRMDDLTTGLQEGIDMHPDEGTDADRQVLLADAGGIQPYDTSGVYVRIPHPDGTPNKYTGVSDPSDYAVSTAYSTVRTLLVVGDVVRPANTAGVPTPNGYVYENIDAGTSDSAAPTWPTTPGETVADNDMVWICRREDTYIGGYKGVSIDKDIFADNSNIAYMAIKADQSLDDGDSSAFNVV